MTTLMKRRLRNGLSPFESTILTPWSNSFVRPWGRDIFTSKLRELNSLLRFDDFFKDDFVEDDSLMPAMNVIELEKEFEIEFAVPGLNKKDFEVSIEEDVLHVCREKEEVEEHKEDDYSRKEFNYKSFKRSMTLPPSVDLNQDVKASYKNGILKVKLLKKEVAHKKETSKKIIEIN